MESQTLLKFSTANQITLEDLFENALIGLHIVGPDGIVVRANSADRDPVGLSDNPQAYIGHHIGEFHAEDPVVEEILEHLLNNRSLINYKADLKTIDGNRAPVSIYSNSKMDGEEFLNTRCYTKVGVEELKSFSKSLKQKPISGIIAKLDELENQNRFDALVDFFANGMVSVHLINGDGIILWANAAELRAMGYEDAPKEYIGQPISKFYANNEQYEEMLNKLKGNESLIEFEVDLIRKDGSLFPVRICSNSRIEDGKFINSRCFTYSVAEALTQQPPRYTWPRNEKMFE